MKQEENNNPFKFGKTAQNKSFTNREKDSEKLYQNLVNGINTMLMSPRRWGKSSLVEKVVKKIEANEKEVRVVLIDLFSINSEQEFLQTLAEKVIKASDSQVEGWLKTAKQFFLQLIPKISFGLDPQTEFNMQFDWEELQRNKSEILNLAERIGKEKKIRFIICIDEFQDITAFEEFEKLEKVLRSNWQRQQHVTYCLYGSKRHMMNDIFNNSSKPFYRFGDVINLQKISKESWVKFIVNSFKRTQKKASKKEAEWIADQMQNHSWYVQQLSHYAWQKTNSELSNDILMSSLEEVINANSPFFIQLVENMTKTQIALLRAIIKGETQLTSTKVMKNYPVGTVNNVSKNKNQFIQQDMIVETEKGYELLDPVFEIWFREKFG